MWTMYFKTDKTSRPKTVAKGTKPSIVPIPLQSRNWNSATAIN